MSPIWITQVAEKFFDSETVTDENCAQSAVLSDSETSLESLLKSPKKTGPQFALLLMPPSRPLPVGILTKPMPLSIHARARRYLPNVPWPWDLTKNYWVRRTLTPFTFPSPRDYVKNGSSRLLRRENMCFVKNRAL